MAEIAPVGVQQSGRAELQSLGGVVADILRSAVDPVQEGVPAGNSCVINMKY